MLHPRSIQGPMGPVLTLAILLCAMRTKKKKLLLEKPGVVFTMPDQAHSVGLIMDRENPALFVAMNLSPTRGCSLLTVLGEQGPQSTPEMGRFLGQPRNTYYPGNIWQKARYRPGDGTALLDPPILPQGHLLRPPLDEQSFIKEAVWQFSFHNEKIRPCA